MTMETANANITLSDTFESKEPLPSAQRALSVECTNEPSYADVSPPICYAGVSTHEPVDPSLHKQMDGEQINLCYSSPESARADDDKEGEGSFLQGVGLLRAVELSSNPEIVDIQAPSILSLSECISSCSVTEISNNTVTTSPRTCVSKEAQSTVKEKLQSENIPEEMDIDEDEDDDDRPLIVDLGDNFGQSTACDRPPTSPAATPSKLAKPKPTSGPSHGHTAVTTQNTVISTGASTALPLLDTITTDVTNAPKLPPPTPSSLPVLTPPSPAISVVAASVRPFPAAAVPPTAMMVSSSAPRVQKPIRPLLAPTFTTFDQLHLGPPIFSQSATTSVVPVTASATTTMRLQPPPPPLHHQQQPLLPPPPPIGAVQFMSVLPPPPAAAFARGNLGQVPPQMASNAVSVSSSTAAAIQLLNFGPLPSYLSAGPTGMLFHPITGGNTGPGGVPSATFHFAAPTPPPLFSPSGHQPQLAPPTSHFGRAMTVTSLGGGGAILPPPPPLAPAPGLPPPLQFSRLPAHPRDKDMAPPPMGSIILADWMTAAPAGSPLFATPPSLPSHLIPTPQPPLLPPPLPAPSFTSIILSTGNIGDPIYASSPCQLPLPPLSRAPIPVSMTAAVSGDSASTATTSVNGSFGVGGRGATLPNPLSTVTSPCPPPPSSPVSSFAVATRRWRPSTNSNSGGTGNGALRRGKCVTMTTQSTPSSIMTKSASDQQQLPSSTFVMTPSANGSPIVIDGEATTASSGCQKQTTTLATSALSRTPPEVTVAISSLASSKVTPSSRAVGEGDGHTTSHPPLPSTKRKASRPNPHLPPGDSSFVEDVWRPPLPSFHPRRHYSGDAPKPLVPASSPSPRRKSSTNAAASFVPPEQQQQQNSISTATACHPLPSNNNNNAPDGGTVAQRKIIAHYIDGHVLYESNLPFPMRDAMAVVEATLRQTCLKEEEEEVGAPTTSITTISCNTDLQDGQRANPPSDDALPPSPLLPVARQPPVTTTNQRKRRSSTVTTTPPPLPTAPTPSSLQPPSPSTSPSPPPRPPSLAARRRARRREERKRKKGAFAVPKVTSTTILKSPSQQNLKHNGGGGSVDQTPLAIESSPQLSGVAIPSVSADAASTATTPKTKSPLPPPPTTKKSPTSQSLMNAALPSRANATITENSNNAAAFMKPSSSPPPPRLPPTSSSSAPPHHHSIASTTAKQNTHPLSALVVPVADWSSERVADFVRATPSCAVYAETFHSNEIDGEALLLLSLEQFTQPPISMKIGHALKLDDRLRQLRQKQQSFL